MGMASRGGSSCAFTLSCSQRALLLWAQPNNQPEVVASGKSRQTGSRCVAVGSMLDRWTMMAIVGRRWAKRGRLLAEDRQKRGFDGVRFRVVGERKRRGKLFFSLARRKRREEWVQVLCRCCWGGAWPSLDWTGRSSAGRVASTVIQRIHCLEQATVQYSWQWASIDKARAINLESSSFCATCPSIIARYLLSVHLCTTLMHAKYYQSQTQSHVPQVSDVCTSTSAAPHVNPQTKTQHSRIKSHPCNLHSGDEWNAPARDPPRKTPVSRL